MSQFRSGSDLSEAIRHVLGGHEVRCAVAFWGAGAEDLIHPGDATRIICDVTMGGTSPAALRGLGAPDNEGLRHLERLHAKVYLSDRGAVVGSANASDAGIGFRGVPSLLEAGVVLPASSEAHAAASTWFEAAWCRAARVDEGALALAASRFHPGPRNGGLVPQPGSLLDMIAYDPDRFSNIAIVLAHIDATDEERTEAKRAVRAAHPGRSAEIDAMPENGMFMGWSKRDLDRWTRTFIELWMPGDRLHVYGRRAYFFEDRSGTVLSRVRWSALRDLVGDLPDAAMAGQSDRGVVRRLRERHGNKVFTARELASAILEL